MWMWSKKFRRKNKYVTWMWITIRLPFYIGILPNSFKVIKFTMHMTALSLQWLMFLCYFWNKIGYFFSIIALLYTPIVYIIARNKYVFDSHIRKFIFTCCETVYEWFCLCRIFLNYNYAFYFVPILSLFFFYVSLLCEVATQFEREPPQM